MQRKTMTMIGAGIAAAGLTVGLLGIANADDSAASGSAVQGPADASTQDRGQRPDETLLTGTDAQRATAAAQAAVPDGTVIRVETDGDGEAAYEAHVRKPDGSEVVVLLDTDFVVTAVQERPARGGRGGPGHGETPLTGADAEAATAAAEAAVPDGTVLRVESDADGTYEAHVRKADGTMVEVKMDGSFAVTSVEEHEGRGGRGHGRGTGDDATGDDSTGDDSTGTTAQSSLGA